METEREPGQEEGFWPEEIDGEGTNGQESVSQIVREATATLLAKEEAVAPSGLPLQPHNFVELGLSRAFLIDLTLRIIHFAGNPTAVHLMRRLGLVQNIVQQIIATLTEEGLCEVITQSDLYTGSYRYRLTNRGKERVMEALEHTRYAGPAPVTADQYIEVMLKQQQMHLHMSRGRAKEVLTDLVMAPQVADAVSRALFSGKSIVLYGPSGNGKTRILDRFAATIDGHALVPYAIYAHGQVIRVFDPSVHHMVETLDGKEATKSEGKMDGRWIRIKRPAVVLSTELGPGSLDLAYDPQSRFYQAPPHLKAQGGVLIVDDFGRQRLVSRNLLARWLIPLERGWDTLGLATGEQVRVPFQLQLLLATSLPLEELADDALLRRILYKVEVPNPMPAEFAEILKRLCHRRKVLLPEGAIDYVTQQFYNQPDSQPRAADARDLVEIVIQNAAFDATEPVLNPEVFDRAFGLLMGKQQPDKGDSETSGA